VPLIARGEALGVVALVSAERGRYGAADLALAEELARRIALALENARLYYDARQAIAMRDQFLSIAAHELKTPLTTVLGYARLLQRRQEQAPTLTERDGRALQTIVAQGVRLEGLINLLLDLSRIEAGRLRIESAELDFAALVRRMVDDTQPGLDQHTLTLEDTGEALPVVGDALRLEQVVQNLIQNALKYSPGGGAVTVRVERQGRQAVLVVRDEGIGIPAEALPQLFQRFYRAPNVHALNISGAGIGLYVVREIVARHDGMIAVASVEGQGSTFTVRLPLAAGGGEPARKRPRKAEGARSAGGPPA
jgi:signal transduction histidine kinase